MRFALLAAILAVSLMQISPAAADADTLPVQYGGEWRGGGRDYPAYRDDLEREERRAMRRERRAERYAAFHEQRMRTHYQRGGRDWARLPDFEKDRYIRDEWERWGRDRWGR
ncbi:hypothetical protein [Roseomonas sp. KE2513]|uniref:hypothetical protein n=1 Tax=Roseomonas sp. KE2513 TaxID=2479202 RepID=UPI0018DF8EDA|nr:hypothetical protein [Roseomonas sp. KE2513]